VINAVFSGFGVKKYRTWLTTLKHPYFSTQQIRVTQKAFKRTKMCIGEESSITWNIKTIESLYVINTPPTYLI